MPQLSLYLDDTSMESLRAHAADEGLSLSKYVKNMLNENAHSSGWPAGWFDLYGSLADVDFPLPDDPPFEDDIPPLEVSDALS